MKRKLLLAALMACLCLCVGLSFPQSTSAEDTGKWYVSAEDGGSYRVTEEEAGYHVKGSLERGNFAFVLNEGINLFGKVSFDLKFKYDMSNLSFYTPHYMQRSFGFVISEPVDGNYTWEKFRKLSNSVNPGTLIEELRGIGFMVSKNDDTKEDPLSAVKDFFVQSFYEDYGDVAPEDGGGRWSTGTMVDQVYHLDQTGADIAATMFTGDRPLHVEVTAGDAAYRIHLRTCDAEGNVKPENIETSYSVYIPKAVGFGDTQYLGIVAQNYAETNGVNHRMNVEFSVSNLSYETRNVLRVSSGAVSAEQGAPASVEFTVQANPASGTPLGALTFSAESLNDDVVKVSGVPVRVPDRENVWRVGLNTNQIRLGKTQVRIATSEGYETFVDVHVHDGSAPQIDVKAPPSVGRQGKKIVLPAPDVTDNSGSARLKVRVVSPEIIELEARLDGKFEFIPSAYGRYRLEYTAVDEGLLETVAVHTIDVAGGSYEEGFDYRLTAAGEQTAKAYAAENGVYVLGGQEGDSVVKLEIRDPIKLGYETAFGFSSRLVPELAMDLAFRRPDKQLGVMWEFYTTRSGTCKVFVYETYYSRLKEELRLLGQYDLDAALFEAMRGGGTVSVSLTRETDGRKLSLKLSEGATAQSFSCEVPAELGDVVMMSVETKAAGTGALSYAVTELFNTALRAVLLPEEPVLIKNSGSYSIAAELKTYLGASLPNGFALTYESLSPELVSVDASGTVRPAAGKLGRAVIVVRSPYGDRAEMEVVSVPDVFAFRTERVTLAVRTAEKLDYELSPSDEPPEFLSEDPETVSVRADGILHAHRAGRVTVTARVGETVIAVVVTVVDDGGAEASRREGGGCAAGAVSGTGDRPGGGAMLLLSAGCVLLSFGCKRAERRRSK